MPLLTIVTRTFNGRPVGMAANVASVDRQKERHEIQRLLVFDQERRGIEWSHINLRNVVSEIYGDYVMLLDDDDFLIVDDLVPTLRKQVALSPDVVIARMNMGDGRILPDDDTWKREPVHSHMPSTSCIVRRDVWNEHVTDFTAKYDGDFDFIRAVWNHGHPFHWWDRVIARVGIISHGRSEN